MKKKDSVGFYCFTRTNDNLALYIYIEEGTTKEKNNEFDPLIIHIDDFMFVIFFRFL